MVVVRLLPLLLLPLHFCCCALFAQAFVRFFERAIGRIRLSKKIARKCGWFRHLRVPTIAPRWFAPVMLPEVQKGTFM